MDPYQLPINLLIADDHQLFIDGITKILETEKMIGDIYSANNGKQVIEKLASHKIDCIIMDINMPLMNGLETTKFIKREAPGIKIIVVSMQCEVAIVSKLMKAGADAFINKDTGKTELLKAINKVIQNEKYIAPDIAQNLFLFYRGDLANTSGNEKHLTKREI